MYVCMSCSDFLKFLFLVNSIVCLSGTLSVWKIRFGHVTYGENWHMTTLLVSLTGTCVKKVDIVVVLGRLPFDRNLRKFRMEGKW